MKRVTSSLGALGLLAALLVATPSPSFAESAAPDEDSVITGSADEAPMQEEGGAATSGVEPYGSYLVDHTKVMNQVRYSDKIGQAQAQSAGITVSIAKGRTATRSIQYGFGVSKDFVAAELNISSSSAVTTTVGCSKQINKKGNWLVAYSVGSIHRYRIKKTVKVVDPGPPHRETTYSDWMYTYNPYQSAISCRAQANP